MNNGITPQSTARLRQMIDASHRIAITCHMSPDGDAMGSSLALMHVLRSMGKDARVFTPDEAPRYLRILPGARTVTAWSSLGVRVESWIASADMVVCLDFNALYRLSALAKHVGNAPGCKAHIDHHMDPEMFADVTISEEWRSSTCELLYHVLVACGYDHLINSTVANCLLGGIITDTGGFNYNSNRPEVFNTVAQLMARGADKDYLVRCLVNTRTESGMRLESYALSQKMEVFADSHAALIYLDRDDLNRFGYRKGDTEGLVNRPLDIPGIVYTCYLRQEKEYIKVSMRSVGSFSVERICRLHYSGGGHLNASGGEFRGTLEEAADIFRGLLAENAALIDAETLDYANRKPLN